MAINLSFINNLIMAKKYNFSKGWSLIDQMTDNSQLVVYNGQTVTKVQKRAMKAAQTRAENAAKKKARNEFLRTEVLPEVFKEIKKTMKSVRNLKTICAFHDNGPVQWSRMYKEMVEIFPEINSALIKYHKNYNEVLATVEKLEHLIKSNKTDKSFFGIAENFGCQMWELLDTVSEVSDAISKSGILNMPTFAGKEIIESSSDGRRPGLKHIMRHTFSTISTTEKNIINLNISLKHAYDELVEYDVNGKRVR